MERFTKSCEGSDLTTRNVLLYNFVKKNAIEADFQMTLNHGQIWVDSYIYIYIDLWFELESFPLKYQHLTFKYKIHSVEVDLYYLK